MSDIQKTEVIIIGAGPCGLFAVFELGLLDLRCHLVDILEKPGGQCAELYPEKPIYDIPALPICTGQELTDRLMEQIAPFDPVFHYGQMADALEQLDDGSWLLSTSAGVRLNAPVVVIAAGGGSFVPKRPPLSDLDDFEASGAVHRLLVALPAPARADKPTTSHVPRSRLSSPYPVTQALSHAISAFYWTAATGLIKSHQSINSPGRPNSKRSQSCAAKASCKAAAQSRIKHCKDTAPQGEKQEKRKPEPVIAQLWREAKRKDKKDGKCCKHRVPQRARARGPNKYTVETERPRGD